MDEPVGDDDLRALRAADPAADVAAPTALRDRVAGIPDAEAMPVTVRRQRRWLLPTAAAAAAVAALGGGYLWGAGGVDLTPAPVPLAVATGAPGDPAAPIGLGGAGGGLDSGGSVSEVGVIAGPDIGLQGIGWWSPVRQRFIVPAFDDAPGQATAYAVDANVQYTAEDAARMAAALGVAGDARENEFDGGWVVGDYAGANVVLSTWGTVSFASGIPDAVTVCENAATALHGRNGPGFGQEMIRCMADTPLPTDELVQESVSLFLAAIDLDEDSFRVSVRPPEGADRNVLATASRIVENNVTEIAAYVTVSAQGIMYASGPTGEIVSLDEYPIVSAAEAAARLNDPGFSPSLVAWPDRSADEPAIAHPTAPPPVPAAGSPIPWSIAEREIISARLGLALLHGTDGVQYLTPAYEFTAADDTVWSVIALTEDDLDTSAAPGCCESW